MISPGVVNKANFTQWLDFWKVQGMFKLWQKVSGVFIRQVESEWRLGEL